MNFLGIGPGEIFLILILMLVVVGPERLPEFARQAGRLVIRVRNWIARSPDAQMVLRAREELEAELQEIRRSLTEEVETVRKELESVRGDLAEAAKMVEESAESVANTKIDLDAAAVDAGRTIAAPAAEGGTPRAPAPSGEVLPAADANVSMIGGALDTPADQQAAPPSPAEANGQPVPRSFKPGQAPAVAARPAAEEPAADAAVEELNLRIEKLSQEFGLQLQALTAELQGLRERRAAPQPQPTAPAESHEPAALLSAAPAADTRRRCKGVTRSGEPCAAPPLKGQEYCRAHAAKRVLEEVV